MPAISSDVEKLDVYVARIEFNDDGTVCAIMPDNTVVSIDTNGKLSYAPPGTKGQYQRAKINGNILVYKPWLENDRPLFYVKFAADTRND